MKKWYSVLIFIYIFNYNVSAQDAFSTVFIKNQDSLNVIIKEVKDWGLLTLDRIHISYRVISSIRTTDYNVVKNINKQVNHLSIKHTEDIYNIDFSNAKLPIRKITQFNPVKSKSICISFSNEIGNNLNSSLSFSPWFSDYIIFRFGFSSDFFKHISEKANFGFIYGTGLEAELSNSRFNISLNYNYNSSYQYQQNWAINFNYQYILENYKNLLLFAGINYILTDLEMPDQRKKMNYHFGIGFNLNNK
jgi:hypothetical protein